MSVEKRIYKILEEFDKEKSESSRLEAELAESKAARAKLETQCESQRQILDRLSSRLLAFKQEQIQLEAVLTTSEMRLQSCARDIYEGCRESLNAAQEQFMKESKAYLEKAVYKYNKEQLMNRIPPPLHQKFILKLRIVPVELAVLPETLKAELDAESDKAEEFKAEISRQKAVFEKMLQSQRELYEQQIQHFKSRFVEQAAEELRLKGELDTLECDHRLKEEEISALKNTKAKLVGRLQFATQTRDRAARLVDSLQKTQEEQLQRQESQVQISQLEIEKMRQEMLEGIHDEKMKFEQEFQAKCEEVVTERIRSIRNAVCPILGATIVPESQSAKQLALEIRNAAERAAIELSEEKAKAEAVRCEAKRIIKETEINRTTYAQREIELEKERETLEEKVKERERNIEMLRQSNLDTLAMIDAGRSSQNQMESRQQRTLGETGLQSQAGTGRPETNTENLDVSSLSITDRKEEHPKRAGSAQERDQEMTRYKKEIEERIEENDGALQEDSESDHQDALGTTAKAAEREGNQLPYEQADDMEYARRENRFRNRPKSGKESTETDERPVQAGTFSGQKEGGAISSMYGASSQEETQSEIAESYPKPFDTFTASKGENTNRSEMQTRSRLCTNPDDIGRRRLPNNLREQIFSRAPRYEVDAE